jgi:hypothetical protein
VAAQRQQLCESTTLAVATACLEMGQQHSCGGGNNGALAAAAWCMLIIILIYTMTMMLIIDCSFVAGEGGRGGRVLAACIAGGCCNGQ